MPWPQPPMVRRVVDGWCAEQRCCESESSARASTERELGCATVAQRRAHSSHRHATGRRVAAASGLGRLTPAVPLTSAPGADGPWHRPAGSGARCGQVCPPSARPSAQLSDMPSVQYPRAQGPRSQAHPSLATAQCPRARPQQSWELWQLPLRVAVTRVQYRRARAARLPWLRRLRTLAVPRPPQWLRAEALESTPATCHQGGHRIRARHSRGLNWLVLLL
mmetsp:Transcript_6673/g.21859  ORF Transcript_6673/g.21859 Transcript_6673/m.21859 type:complete len:221 (-) Transcript_6673:810-1472(-)